ncbi:MAG: hypothetical protein KDK89_03900 [Alphaproteobacteria bacterium]|nr:hypothetical protein [Alphaproteobacteria bacterium]
MSDVHQGFVVARPEIEFWNHLLEVDFDRISVTRFDSAPQRVQRTRQKKAERISILPFCLHRIFNEHGTTVCAYVMVQRLSLTHEKLANSAASKPTIGYIAYVAGFNMTSREVHMNKCRIDGV